MSLEEKLSRIRKLSQIQFPSDQEIEEKSRLEDEVELIYNEETTTKPFKETEVKLGEGKGFVISSKKQKKSLLDILIVKLRKKPATWDEIQQLKLEKIKESLKADIKIAKWKQRNPGGKPKQSSIKLRGEKEVSTSKAFHLGSNDSKRYKDLTG